MYSSCSQCRKSRRFFTKLGTRSTPCLAEPADTESAIYNGVVHDIPEQLNNLQDAVGSTQDSVDMLADKITMLADMVAMLKGKKSDEC